MKRGLVCSVRACACLQGRSATRRHMCTGVVSVNHVAHFHSRAVAMAPKRAAEPSTGEEVSSGTIGAAGGSAGAGAGGTGKRVKLAPTPFAGPPTFQTGQFQPVAKLADVQIPAATDGSKLKLLCWNVNGFRAAVKREGQDNLVTYLQRENADILCLQETKVDDKGMQDASVILAGLYPYVSYSCSTKAGYAGVATFSKRKPELQGPGIQGVGEEEGSGRIVTTTWATASSGIDKPLTVVNAYVPNSGMKLERLGWRCDSWDPALRAHMHTLAGAQGQGAGSTAASTVAEHASLNGGRVLLLGDLNVAFHDCDVHTPGTNRNKTPGFCDAERSGFAALLGLPEGSAASSGAASQVLHDVWRERHPALQQFTYWTARFGCRGQNKGWRLDYALASAALAQEVKAVTVRADFPGTDHVPIAVEL